MEDIFQILIFVAFAVLSFIPQLIKGKKEPKVPSGTSQEMLEEVFPEMNEEKEIWMEECQEKTIIRENKPLKKGKYFNKYFLEYLMPKQLAKCYTPATLGCKLKPGTN